MGVNKVIFDDETIIDLTGDTVTADKLLEGTLAHGADGETVTGSIPNNGDVNSAIQIGTLKSGFTSGGTIANLIASNIKQGVTIAGIMGTLESGGIKTGTVNRSNNQFISITHNLGKTPTFFAAFPNFTLSNNNHIEWVVYACYNGKTVAVSGTKGGNMKIIEVPTATTSAFKIQWYNSGYASSVVLGGSGTGTYTWLIC